MNLFNPVSTIMSVELITVSKNDPIELVAEIFEKNNIHHVLVTEECKLTGIVSRDDLYFFMRKGIKESEQVNRMKKYKVDEIMTTKIAKLDPQDKITIALEVFKKNILRALPVVENQIPVGIVTPLDIIKNLSEAQKAESTYNL